MLGEMRLMKHFMAGGFRSILCFQIFYFRLCIEAAGMLRAGQIRGLAFIESSLHLLGTLN